MFQAVELGNKVDKASYKEAVPQLRVDLLNLQFDLKTAPFSMVVVLAGVDRIGCDNESTLLICMPSVDAATASRTFTFGRFPPDRTTSGWAPAVRMSTFWSPSS